MRGCGFKELLLCRLRLLSRILWTLQIYRRSKQSDIAALNAESVTYVIPT